MRRVLLTGVITCLAVSTAHAQTYSWPYVRQGSDGIFYSQLDNPEVLSTYVLGNGEQLDRVQEGFYWTFATTGFTTWTAVEMLEPGTNWFSTVEQMRHPSSSAGFTWPAWEQWSEAAPGNLTWTTTTIDYSATGYHLGPSDAAEVISYGLKIGDGVSRVRVYVDHIPDPNDLATWDIYPPVSEKLPPELT